MSESLVRSWVAEATLAHFRLGGKGKRGKILIAEDDLDGLLAAFKVGGRAVAPAPRVRPVRPKHLSV